GRTTGRDAFAEQRGDGEREPVAGVDRGGAHTSALRGDTSGSPARFPATALTCASQSTAPPAISFASEVIRRSSTERSTSNSSSVRSGVGRRYVSVSVVVLPAS